MLARNPLESFEEKIWREPNSGCHLWTARCDKKGYGWFKTRISSERLAHRFSYLFYRGGIPPTMHVLHKCDTPGCVRPEHLFLGTNDDNCRDKVSKGRQAKGESHSSAKLTSDDIIAIRADMRPCKIIASQYGIDLSSIYSIRRGRVWKHV